MIQTDASLLRASLVPFVDLAGRAACNRRIAHLRRELQASPFRAKIILDYHWLELVLGKHMDAISADRSGEPLASEDLAALAPGRTTG